MDTIISTSKIALQLEALQKTLPVNYTTRNVTRLNEIFMQYLDILNQEENTPDKPSEQEKNDFIENIGIARYSLSWKTGRMHFAKAHGEMLEWITNSRQQLQQVVATA